MKCFSGPCAVACTFVFIAFTGGAVARADSVTGAYATGDGTDGNQATPLGVTPPYTLTATSSTFSYVEFYPTQTFTFAQLTGLSATFTSNSGGSGGGSPRLRILLDADQDMDPVPSDNDGNDASISVYLGNSPNFTDNDATLNMYSNLNVIGNNDAGRYDTSELSGGSPFTTYANALASYGNLTVLRFGYVIDTFDPYPSRNETLDSINASFQPASVIPEPGSLVLFASGLLGLVGIARRRKAA